MAARPFSLVLLWTLFCSVLCANGSQKECKYKNFPGARLDRFLYKEEKEDVLAFPTLGEAKEACQLLNSCGGVVLDGTHAKGPTYSLAQGFPVFEDEGQLWIKECNPHCRFTTKLINDGHSGIFERECSEQTPQIKNTIGTWSLWSNWGRCSHSCGADGTQMRRRNCIYLLRSNPKCNGSNEEFRRCNTDIHCMKRMLEVYGISGPEGFVVSGTTSIFQSCVHTEPSMRKACGQQSKITREKCSQYNCCYQESDSEVEGPKCFQTENYIGSHGRLGWAVWSRWTFCSVTCGNGQRKRERTCTGDLPGSVLCPGQDTEVEICDMGGCPCDQNPCQNGGVCFANNKIMTGYECKCAMGYAGKNCVYDEPLLSCGKDFISISFHEGIIIEDGLIPDPSLIQFASADRGECFSQKRDNSFLLALPPPIDESCGSQLITENDRLLIRNQVLWRLSDGFVDATVVIVDITCVYNKDVNSTIGLGFGIRPTVRTITEKRVTQSFDADMYIYRDNSFSPSHRYRTSPKIAQGEIIYVSIDLKRMEITKYENMTILAEWCAVVDTSKKKAIVHELIKDGCSTNPLFTNILANGVAKQARWALRVFDWKNQDRKLKEVNLQCRVRACVKNCSLACDENSFANRSKQQMAVQGGGRRKRSLVTKKKDKLRKLVNRRIYLI